MTNLSLITETHANITVVRDTLLGGTKSRYLAALFDGVDEVVYASSHCGGGQVALAYVAHKLGKRCTVVCAARAEKHPRQIEAQRLGAKYVEIRPGYQSVLNARAREYCARTGARLAPFGLKVEQAADVIAKAARSTGLTPDIIWVSGGSGTLASGLAKAWPKAKMHICQVGAVVNVPGAEVHVAPQKYEKALPASACPFDADGHYERKTWQACQQWLSTAKLPKGTKVVMWSPMGSPKLA